MTTPPKGYWYIHQAVRWAEIVRAERHKTREGLSAAPFGGANIGHSAAHVVREALECGELRAVGVSTASGVLVTIPAAAWRVSFFRPEDSFRHNVQSHFGFPEAMAGRIVPVAGSWAMPILAQADFARWVGEETSAEPPERPHDWPTALPGVAPGSGVGSPMVPTSEQVEATIAPARRNRGGRPERDDWHAFDKQMMRRMALDGGELTLRDFKRDMKVWAAENMEPTPDDRTIERRVTERAPLDVFAPD